MNLTPYAHLIVGGALVAASVVMFAWPVLTRVSEWRRSA